MSDSRRVRHVALDLLDDVMDVDRAPAERVRDAAERIGDVGIGDGQPTGAPRGAIWASGKLTAFCMPNYKDTLRPFGDAAMKIVYVEYELPGPDRMPWSAHPTADGKFDSLLRARQQDRAARSRQRRDQGISGAGVRTGMHSAVPAPDGSVWLTGPDDGAGTRRRRRSRSIRTTSASTPSASIPRPATSGRPAP